MSWSDDARCLHCDGKLPLFRKLKDGQFCSAAHRKAYWAQQQQLGVERLMQTGQFLAAFQPAAPQSDLSGGEEIVVTVEDLGTPAAPVVERAPDAGAAPAEVAAATPVQAAPKPSAADIALEPKAVAHAHPVPVAARAAFDLAEAPLAADPLEYEMAGTVARPECPAREIAASMEFALSLAGIVRMTREAATAPMVRASADACESAWRALVSAPSTPFEALAFEPREARRVGVPVMARAEAPALKPRPEAALTSRPSLPGYSAQPQGDFSDILIELVPARTAPLRWRAVEASEAPTGCAIAPEGWMALNAAPAIPASECLSPAREMPQSGRTPLVLRLAETAARPFWSGDVPLPVAASPVSLPEITVTGLVPEADMPGMGALFALTLTDAGRDWNPDALSSAVAEPMNPGLMAPRSPFAAPVAALAGSGRRFPLRFAGKSPKEHAIPYPASLKASQPRVYFAMLPASDSPLKPVLREEIAHPAPTPVFDAASDFAFAPGATALRIKARRSGEDSNHVLDRLHPGAILAPVASFWRNAPRDLKVLAMALPFLVTIAIQPSLPKVRVNASMPTGDFNRVMQVRMNNLKQNIAERAGVELSEDFRGGLDDWRSKSDLAAKWSFDASGFVKPGPLAIYEPSMKLTDYQAQFLAQIDRKAVGFAYRAQDLDNYMVVRLVVLKPGPLPTMGIERYTVINGKPGPRTERILPLTTRQDMMYRVSLDAQGDYFALRVQGYLVDFWSDSRWKSGGVGFFNSPGEQSRVRWLQVSHQYDALGRLCAYLAPYGQPGPVGLKD